MISVVKKPIYWCGDSLESLRSCEPNTKAKFGFQLSMVQSGLEPSHWKPMENIASGVREIRLLGKNNYRLIYVAKFEDKIYVLHFFEKKTQKTPKSVIDIVKSRYQRILKERNLS